MDYYNEIERIIKDNEINKQVRELKNNRETLVTYGNIGRLLIEAQNGEERAKYGEGFIKEWSKKLVLLYAKGYDYTNLSRFRQFYLSFRNLGPLGQLSWSLIRTILPIKDINKRNYYINLCLHRNLSKRELIMEIKNNAYERLVSKPQKIEIISNNTNYNIKEHIKNPIIIKLRDEDKILKEHDLEMKILSELKDFFTELGEGYAFVGNEYKLKFGGKNYRIDILLFNFILNSFVVIELKTRELRKEDKAQIEFYMNLVDKNLKQVFHNETIGIIVSRYQDDYIVSFVSKDNLFPISYELI